ncbi:MAG: pyridoxamine 5'-phosphate oxidase family protein [Candidatus Dormibacteraeota bacterium]|nr:pyridoxamine 5'-phosphate oxidase family protein [Candidatus Dormibacteraeota bacterium]
MRDLTRDQCFALLGTVAIGRVGVSIDALPVILPVNFVVLEDWILFRTVPGTKLDAAMRRSVAAFEADDHAPDGSWGWSVLIRGFAHDLRDGRGVPAAGALHPWPFPHGEANHVVGIEATMVTGRRFGTVIDLPGLGSRSASLKA